MDLSAIPLILRELNLNEDCVVNIYNHGSWVYGSNSPTSDRDLVIVTRFVPQDPLIFMSDFDYFHGFELHKLWNQYDVCVYSAENFETLLKTNFLIAVQCVFLPDEFKIKEKIDFKKIYLDKYYDKLRLKQVAFYENLTALNLSDGKSKYPSLSSRSSQSTHNDYIFKNLFHGLRYLDFVEQLIQTRSIHNFRRVTYLFNEMKNIRGDSTEDPNMLSVIEFVRAKSVELKCKLDELVPTNTITGKFEAQITFDSTDDMNKTFDELERLCANTKYKIILNESTTHRNRVKPQELIVSLFYSGEYPSIVQKIEKTAYKHFQDFNIIGIKIKSLVSNEGVPKTTIENRLFWDERTNHFEIYYKVLLGNDRKRDKLETLQIIYRLFYSCELHLSPYAIKRIDEKNFYNMITMRLLDANREQACQQYEHAKECLAEHGFQPFESLCEFIVYDTNVKKDDDSR